MRMRNRGRRAVAVLGLAVLLGSVTAPTAVASGSRSAAAPAAGAAADRSAVPSALRGPEISDGFTGEQAAAARSASAQAKASGKPVVVDALTTSYSTTTANPSGTYTYDESVLPERVQRNGSWVATDTTLVRNPDGSYRPAATVNALMISAGGTGPMASMTDDGTTLAVSWPGRLPAPEVSGSTAIYRNVLPGVDLQIVANVYGGFSDVLVVHDAEAAANPALARLSFPVSTRGITLHADVGGNLTATDAKGRIVFTAAAPSMWDSNTRLSASAGAVAADPSTVSAPGLAARQRQLGARLSGSSLTLTPDPALLKGADTRYPVYIDPSYTPQNSASGPKQHFDEVKQGSPCNGVSLYDNTSSAGDDGQLGVGYMGFAGGCEGTMRAYYQLQVPSQIWAPNSHILSAYLDASVPYAAANGTNSGNVVYLHATSGINSGTDWNNQPGAGTTVSSATFTTTSNFPNTAVSFNVKNSVQSLANGKASNWTVAMYNKYETSNDIDFVRFADNPHLQISYDHTPNVPATSSMSATSGTTSLPCVTSGTLPWLGKAAATTPPTLAATISDPDGNAVSATFHYLKSGGTAAALPATAIVSSGTKVTSTLPSSFITGLGTSGPSTIEYYATTYDGLYTSGNSATCEFIYDPATPAAPTVTSTVYPPVTTSGPAAGTSGAFTLDAASGESVTHFVYRLDAVPPTGSTQCTGSYSVAASSNKATVNLAAPSPGVHTLYAYSCDGANNASDPASYQFSATNDPNKTYSSLSAAFDNVAISTSSTSSGSANADGGGNSLPSSELGAYGWTSGATVQVDGTSIALPAYGTGNADNVLAANQTITVGKTGNALVFLVFGNNASFPEPDYSADPANNTAPLIRPGVGTLGTFCTFSDATPLDCAEPTGTLTYTDSSGVTSTHTFYLNAPDWVQGPADQAVITMPERDTPSGTQAATTSIFSYAVPLDPTKTLTSVTLPDVSNSVSSSVNSHSWALHVLGMGVRANTTAGAPSGDTWAGAWSAPVESTYSPSSGSWDNQTFRTVIYPTLSGTTARITLSNAQGAVPLTIGAASIAPQSSSGGAAAAVAPIGLTFNGKAGVTIPAGAEATSDPLTLTSASSFTSFAAQNPYVVSYQLTNTSVATLPGHGYSGSYVTGTGSGNHTGDTAATSFSAVSGHSVLLSRLDIAAPAGTPAVAVLGNNIIISSSATPGGGLVRLAGQIAQNASGYGVVDASIENNQIGADASSASSNVGGRSAMARLDRDVLDVPGLNTVVINEGLTDLFAGGDDVTLETNYTALVSQLNAWGLNVIIGTLTPCHGYGPCTTAIDDGTVDTGSGLGYRTNVNNFLMNNFTNNALTPYYDAVDFDATVATVDASSYEVLASAADTGDHVNLTATGNQALLSATDSAGGTLAALLSAVK